MTDQAPDQVAPETLWWDGRHLTAAVTLSRDQAARALDAYERARRRARIAAWVAIVEGVALVSCLVVLLRP